MIVSYFNDIIKIETVIPVLNAYHKDSISRDEVYAKLYEIAPSLKKVKIDYQIFRLLIQSSFNILLNIPDFEDSSFIIIPAARALEGHLKYMFEKELGIKIKKKNFCYFNKDVVNDTYSLQTKHALNTTVNIVQCINDCYNTYSSVRHVVSHFGDIAKGDTVFLSTNDSKLKITDILEVISRYF